MKKSFTLHIDAAVVLVLIFVLAFAAIVYQRWQYNNLLDEHIQLQWKAQDADVNVHYLRGMLKKYQANENSQTETVAEEKSDK